MVPTSSTAATPLLVSTHDIAGGAARAAHRLCQGLRAAEVDARLLVQQRHGEDAWVDGPTGPVRRRLARASYLLNYGPAAPHLLAPWREGGLFSPPPRVGTDLAAAVADRNPDIVHLHWVNGYVDLESLAEIEVPIVWTMHDAWPFTGGCHYPRGCERYTGGCGRCPQAAVPFAGDASRRWFEEKRRALADLELSLVAPSEWLAEMARDSPVVGDRPVTVIPNGLDTDRFRPQSREASRETVGIEADRTVVLLAGLDPQAPHRKGIDLLNQCLADLAATPGTLPGDTAFVAFGDARLSAFGLDDLPLDVRSLGYVSDATLRALYATADVAVVPSRYESFGQVASEAQAAGTPVVAFDATGLRDVVVHETTGYAATPYDPADLAAGIRWVCADEERQAALGAAARERAVSSFAVEDVVRDHRALYDRLAHDADTRQN